MPSLYTSPQHPNNYNGGGETDPELNSEGWLPLGKGQKHGGKVDLGPGCHWQGVVSLKQGL